MPPPIKSRTHFCGVQCLWDPVTEAVQLGLVWGGAGNIAFIWEIALHLPFSCWETWAQHITAHGSALLSHGLSLGVWSASNSAFNTGPAWLPSYNSAFLASFLSPSQLRAHSHRASSVPRLHLPSRERPDPFQASLAASVYCFPCTE